MKCTASGRERERVSLSPKSPVCDVTSILMDVAISQCRAGAERVQSVQLNAKSEMPLRIRSVAGVACLPCPTLPCSALAWH